MAKRRSLFKFYSELRWAENFLDGKLRFQSLSYYRDYEDKGVRGDPFEGSEVYRPDGGLVITNKTRGIVQTLAKHSFVSRVRCDEILIFCLSKVMTDELWNRFDATACVEITDPVLFCSRVETALPPPAVFGGSYCRQRIGGRVNYYDPSRTMGVRPIFPEQIALAKRKDFSWQDEFRLVFSQTDGLNPTRTEFRIVSDELAVPRKSDEHPIAIIEVGNLHDICKLHSR